MKRIFLLTDLYPKFPGGAEALVFRLARSLMHSGHEVQVLTGYEHPVRGDGPPVVRADISLDAAGWAICAEAIGVWRPDVILTHHLYARVFHVELAALGLPIVEVVLNGQRMPEAALAVFISGWVADRGGFLPGDLVITPPVFDDVIATSHGDQIGFVKPYPHKGAELVYQIAAAMPERRFVVLRGEWPSEEVVVDGLHNVEHLAPVDDMRDFYARCHLVLMPSRSEDAGTVAQEATANGLPCISSDREGLNETNAGGIRLSPAPENLGAWVDTIRSLDDPGRYRDVVRSQQVALAACDQPARLAELARRIEMLR